MQATKDKTSLHFVYVVDEEGMVKIFADLKQKLVMQHHATLICFSSEDNFAFNKEMEILKNRYSSQIVCYQVREDLINASTSIRELLETVINSNTKDNLLFILSQDAELIHVVSNVLWFLETSKDQIQIG